MAQPTNFEEAVSTLKHDDIRGFVILCNGVLGGFMCGLAIGTSKYQFLIGGFTLLGSAIFVLTQLGKFAGKREASK